MIRCFNQVLFRDHVQESYETGSADCRQRGKLLRTYGFRVTSQPLGPQLTFAGKVNVTLLTAYGDMEKLPSLDLVRL